MLFRSPRQPRQPRRCSRWPTPFGSATAGPGCVCPTERVSLELRTVEAVVELCRVRQRQQVSMSSSRTTGTRKHGVDAGCEQPVSAPDARIYPCVATAVNTARSAHGQENGNAPTVDRPTEKLGEALGRPGLNPEPCLRFLLSRRSSGRSFRGTCIQNSSMHSRTIPGQPGQPVYRRSWRWHWRCFRGSSKRRRPRSPPLPGPSKEGMRMPECRPQLLVDTSFDVDKKNDEILRNVFVSQNS